MVIAAEIKNEFLQEMRMGQPRYLVKVPELVEYLAQTGQLEGIPPAMYLVRKANIAVNTAYKIIDPEERRNISLDTCWKVFDGLCRAEVKQSDPELETCLWHHPISFIIDRADQALYVAKRIGKSRVASENEINAT